MTIHKEVFLQKKSLLNRLEKINEELQLLESKFQTTSLLKIHFIETTKYEGLLFKRKKIVKRSGVYPNIFIIDWLQTSILEIHESYAQLLEVIESFPEQLRSLHSPFKEIMEMCFMCHSHLDALKKENKYYFSQLLSLPIPSFTFHKIERVIEEHFYDFRIRKEELLAQLRLECKALDIEDNV